MRLGAEPIFWVTVNVFCPESPRKSVLRRGTDATVPASTRTASPSVTQECRRVQLRIGTYAFCRREGGAVGDSGSTGLPSASRITFPGLRNHEASTGTIVKDTRSDAVIAIVTVSANGRNSSPVTSPTNAMGRKTATEVIVDAVMAAATSRTARMIVGIFSASPT